MKRATRLTRSQVVVVCCVLVACMVTLAITDPTGCGASSNRQVCKRE